MRARVLLPAVCLLALGCAGARPASEPLLSEVEESRGAVTPVAPVAAAPTPEGTRDAGAAPARAQGPLTRAEAQALVARGLGSFLATVRVSPVFQAGRFQGFRLDDAENLPEWQRAGADLRRGDVLVRINGVRIERPEQALWAFERLRVLPAITVEFLRDGQPRTLETPILESPAAPLPQG